MDNNSIKKQIDDTKTAAEHEAIILKYQNTGYLDRVDAIQKYNNFNDSHPEYYISMTTAATVLGSAAQIDQVSNDVIVGNLKAQLLYITRKNMLGDKEND